MPEDEMPALVTTPLTPTDEPVREVAVRSGVVRDWTVTEAELLSPATVTAPLVRIVDELKSPAVRLVTVIPAAVIAPEVDNPLEPTT